MVQKNNKKKEVYFYDIEQFPNFHSCLFINKITKEEKVFIIFEENNQLEEYINFLSKEVSGLIGFNNINYDYPMLHYILLNYKNWKNKSSNYINSKLYQESQRIVNERFSAIAEWNTLIPQLDVFVIHHFDNAAKRTSLKQIEFVINWKDLSDYGQFDKKVIFDEVYEIIKYNRNDVLATIELYNLTIPDIDLRKNLSKKYNKDKYNISFLNSSDTKIGSDIFLYEYCLDNNLDKNIIKKLKSERDYINVNDLIFPYISFKTKNFNSVLNKFKDSVLYSDEKFKHSIMFKGVKYVYGEGGLHACIKPGIYYSNDKYIIIDIDVASFYPNIAIENKLFPEHLGESFCNNYKSKYLDRKEAKKLAKQGINEFNNKLIVSVYKLLLNGTYGNSKNKYSWLFDPYFTNSITINGQLMLSMLAERILLNIKSSTLLQANTDGITILLERGEVDELYKWCAKWEKLTKLELEYAEYSKMIIRDVNNYLAIKNKPEEELYPEQPESYFYDNNYTKHKTKGAFEIVKTQNGKIAFNKNWSFVCVTKAVYDYYIYNKSIEDSIYNNKNIFDFCGYYKANKGFEPVLYVRNDNKFKKYLQQGRIRYYNAITKTDQKLKKEHSDGRSNFLHVGYNSIIFNKYEEKEFEEYKVDYSFYIKEAKKIIESVENNKEKQQLKLFI